MSKSPGAVDALINTKDRPLQLHFLLESLSRYVSGLGRVTVSYQASNPDFKAGYDLLLKRLETDECFERLRNSAEILLKERHSLAEAFDAVKDTGRSEYLVPLVDDEVFYRPIDLVNAPAARFFFENPDVLACALRLGLNISKLNSAHASALGLRALPKFELQSKDLLVWSWPRNLDVPHWNCICSITSHIYRKKTYLDWFTKYGKENFMRIEARAMHDLVRRVLRIPKLIHSTITGIDWAHGKILKPFGIWEQEFVRHRISRALSSNRIFVRPEVPTRMSSPAQSVNFVMDLNTVSGREGITKYTTQSLNQKYLNGEALSFQFVDRDAPWSPTIPDYPFVQFRRYTGAIEKWDRTA